MRALLLIIFLGQPAFATDWIISGGVAYPNGLPPSERDNTLAELSIRAQRPVADVLGGQLLAYGIFFANRDTEGYSYNSKNKLTFGAEIRYKVSPHGRLSFGARYSADYRNRSDIWYNAAVATVDYSHWQRIERRDKKPVVFSGWANLRFPGGLDESNEDNLVAQGRFELAGAGLTEGAVTLLPFAAVKFSTDSAEFGFNNFLQSEVGGRLKWKVRKKLDMNISLRYRTDRRYKDNVTHKGWLLRLGWWGKF